MQTRGGKCPLGGGVESIFPDSWENSNFLTYANRKAPSNLPVVDRGDVQVDFILQSTIATSVSRITSYNRF
jgi:hypothetical protein